MKKLYELYPYNFGQVYGQSLEKAKICVIPVPYEATLSYQAGAGRGPAAIIEASRHLDEMWDSLKEGELSGFKTSDVYTFDEVILSKNSVIEALKCLEQFISEEVVKKEKFPLVLGGEHSLTFPAVKALKRKYKDLSVLHFDAHTDLLNSFEDSKYNHACVMRRIHELNIKTVSIGIRNINYAVTDYLKKRRSKNVYYMPEIPGLEKILKALSKNVYLTFDLDAFDPSIMPSVGTPEPGGLFWWPTIELLNKIIPKVNLVGADVMELKPIPGLEAPNFLAAKLVYHIIRAKLTS
ncbi:MAG: agmatinase [Patescibacteria group bacterium]